MSTRGVGAGETGNCYVGALQKLERGTELSRSPTARPATAHLSIANPPAGVTGMMGRLFSTHPPMADRIAATGDLDRRVTKRG